MFTHALGTAPKRSQLCFSMCFIIGLLLGALLARFTIGRGNATIVMAATCSALLPVQIVIMVVPLAISVLAVRLSASIAFFPLCLIRSFTFGYCSCGVFMAFQSAGWLIKGLLLFSDSILIVPLLWFWLRHLDGSRQHLKSDALLYVGFSLIVCFLDFLYISPFLALILQG